MTSTLSVLKRFTTPRGPRAIVLAGIAVAAAVIGSVATPASAQLGFAGGFAEAFEPDYVNRDMRTIADELELDEDQRIIIESLFVDYKQAFDEGLERMRDGMQMQKENLAGRDPKELMNELFAPVNEWRAEKLRMKDQFMQDVKAFMKPEQLELWPGFERKFLRAKALSPNKCKLSGESTNLFTVLRDMEWNRGLIEQIRPILNEYEVALHDALVRRDDVIRQSHGDMIRMMQTDDGALGVAILSRQIAERVHVRDVNEQYAWRIAETLPDEFGSKLMQSILNDSYPRVYRPTAVSRMFAAAKQLSGLDENTRAAIAELEIAYLAELEIYNEQLVATIKESEPKMIVERAERQAARMRGGERQPPVDDPVRAEFRRRDQAAEPYVQQLRSLLTPEQFASLPGATRWLQRNERIDEAQADRPDAPRTRDGKPAQKPRGTVRNGAATASAKAGANGRMAVMRLEPAGATSARDAEPQSLRDIQRGAPRPRPRGADSTSPTSPRANPDGGSGGGQSEPADTDTGSSSRGGDSDKKDR